MLHTMKNLRLRRAQRPPASRVLLQLETLEERCLLSGGITTPTGLVNAIANANAAGGGTVTLSSGATAIDFSVINNTTNGGNALPVITGNITIIGNGVTIERDTSYVAPYRFFDVAGGGSLTLENLILQDGLAKGQGTAAEGGAIYVTGSGSLTLTGVTVENCDAEAYSADGYGYAEGGGIFYNGGGSVFLSKDFINKNEAAGFVHSGSGAGGGALVEGAHSVTLANDTFNSNKATGAGGYTGPQSGAGGPGGAALGGGLYVSSTTLIISNDKFIDNEAIGGKGGNGGQGLNGGPGATGGEAVGGGLYVYESNLTLNGDSISSNSAVGGAGGNGGYGYGIFGGNGGTGGTGGRADGGGVFTTSIPASDLPILIRTAIPTNNIAAGGVGGTGGAGLVHGGSNGGNGGSTWGQMNGSAMILSPGSPLPSGTVGTPYAQTITAQPYNAGSSPSVSYNFISSPLGLSFNTDGPELIISGTPTAAGTVTFTLTAADSEGTTQPIPYSLTINPSAQPPAFTSVASTAFTVGDAGSFPVIASGFPSPTLRESGALPGGVTFNTVTGILSGTPAAGSGGVYTLHFTASNSAGSVGQTFTLTVNQTPAITSGNSATFTAGQGGSFSVTATGFPAPSLTELGTLPSGVAFTNNGNGTATLGGTPAVGTQGTYQFTITAHNGVGSDFTQSFTLTVIPSLAPPPPPPPPPPAQPIVPLLLEVFNLFLGGVETVGADSTTITDNFFGFPLVETYDYFGNLVSVTLIGFNITFLFG